MILYFILKHISYLNGQFYSDYSKEAYDEVVKNGYPSQKVVMGMLSGMDFEDELIPGVLVKRYKRFFVDIKLKNKIITAHCPNSGSMLNLLKKGNPVWFTKAKNDKRKLKYTLQIIEVDRIKYSDELI